MTVMVGPVAVSDKVALVVIAGAVVLVIGGLWYVKRKVGQAADAVADAAADVVAKAMFFKMVTA